MIVERGTKADHPARMDLVPVFGNPFLLFEKSEANPDDIGLAVIDLANDVGLLFVRQLAKWRLVRAANDQSGKLRLEPARHLLDDALLAAVKEMTPAPGYAISGTFQLQHRTVETMDAIPPCQAGHDHPDS